MREWTTQQIADAARAELAAPGAAGEGPSRVTIDSRDVRPGDLFVGLPGARVDGGVFAAQALADGAWGVLIGPGHEIRTTGRGVVLRSDEPLVALQTLATAWRRALGAKVIGITGSTGKTSTKDVLAGMLAPHLRTVATRQNLNTEIGVPLTILGAPEGTEALVLEMAMRGPEQIAELTEIAEPDVGVIVNIGPVHLELLGSIEAIAAAKAELIRDLPEGATAIVPADEPLLEPHRTRQDLVWVTFGPGGDVDDLGGVELPFTSAHMRVNGLAALAAARAIGVEPHGPIDVALSDMRGQRRVLAGEVTVIDDCYNANPMSMRAALNHLAEETHPPARRVAVLGDMLELGPDERRFHAEVGAHARERGVELLIAVGPRAAAMVPPFGGEAHAVPDAQAAAALLPTLVRSGDTVLIKASRGVGLEVVADALDAAIS
ncbi:UDP-N-acetylmuramoyl-tripeptide--D-alanyl-D-alanine ligase [Svornostia abyssi]|uniref:UDP-N-acetylmuramoyl-tripeptide--D-alanyl-D-alanine ligase n=1 Tax=Svornostia abyssi TaxID=2898438 RepID=A0ABY5PBS8_9ACTN|nr:UDP-N-acetylmuramoyl-tripeptide--D-alanyl-D-alanine ligase [Parviterribacteraceae bacterium J379]